MTSLEKAMIAVAAVMICAAVIGIIEGDVLLIVAGVATSSSMFLAIRKTRRDK